MMPHIPVAVRRSVFAELVGFEDFLLKGPPVGMCDLLVTQSREHIMKQFGITKGQLAGIIEEGLALDWPPLTGDRPKYSHDAYEVTPGPEPLARAESRGMALSARMRERRPGA
jgi:hypothetical protein